MLGLTVDNPAVTAYTAIIQLGAIAATVVYFFKDIVRLLGAWFRGLRSAQDRTHHDYQLAWAVIVGSIPVAIVGFLARKAITGGLRSLWVVAAALILWSAVMWVAERRHGVLEKSGVQRGEGQVTMRDGVVIGLVQCFSLIPGVSRSGATISAGLINGLDRVTATRLSFFMAIPALTAAGLYELKDVNASVVGFGQLGVGHRDRLRRRLCQHRVAADIRGTPPDHDVRLVSRRPGTCPLCCPGRRLAERHLSSVVGGCGRGYNQPDLRKARYRPSTTTAMAPSTMK